MDDQRDYEEETWQRAEIEREAIAEQEHERACQGCDYCAPLDVSPGSVCTGSEYCRVECRCWDAPQLSEDLNF